MNFLELLLIRDDKVLHEIVKDKEIINEEKDNKPKKRKIKGEPYALTGNLITVP